MWLFRSGCGMRTFVSGLEVPGLAWIQWCPVLAGYPLHMGGEPDEVESVESVPASATSWPLMLPDRYEAQFVSSFQSPRRPPPDPTNLRYTMKRLGFCGALLLVSVGCLVGMWVTQTPDTLRPLPYVSAVAVVAIGCIVASVVVLRRVPGEVINPSEPELPPYAFAITPTTIEFPATMYQPAMSWERSRTVGKLAGYNWTEHLVLRCPGQRTRRYAGWTLADAPEDLVARISGRGGRSARRAR